MADWKTYAKAARNTAKKQAPGAREAAQRATSRAGGYARAAGRALDQGRYDDDASQPDERRADDQAAPRSAPQSAPRPETPTRSFRDEAKIYAVVASRTAERAGTRAKKAGIGGRIARAVRDALLIGGSLLIIWGVLYAAGLPIPFSAVLIVVGIIVLIALASGLYAQFARDRKPPEADEADDLEAPDQPEG
ncbi:hypothetical protein ACTXPS_01635 [Brachybacterium tyrofermentans]|uniref:hypothetical protein n=1 Tax=Brachybacterium tyrofermentans TaxID=47848 RepID=UPI003FD02DB8